MRSYKAPLIIGFLLLFLGISTCVVSYVVFRFEPSALAITDYVTTQYDVPGGFRDIEIKCSTEEVNLLPSSDGMCRVVFNDREWMKTDAHVDGERLVVSSVEGEKPKNDIGIITYPPTVKVYLPAGGYRSLTLSAGLGKIALPDDLTFEDICVRVMTGSVRCEAAVKNSIDIKTTTGDVTLEDVICSGDCIIECATGDIELEDCDAGSFRIRTGTGNVRGTLLSGKEFAATSRLGDIDVPESSDGGRCEISTGTGNINIEVDDR